MLNFPFKSCSWSRLVAQLQSSFYHPLSPSSGMGIAYDRQELFYLEAKVAITGRDSVPVYNDNVAVLQDIPIKRKLTAIIMIASTAALLRVSAGFMGFELFSFRKTMKSDLLTLAQFIGDRSTAALAFKNTSDAEEELHALTHRKHIAAAAFYDEDGNIFAVYPPEAVKDIPIHPDPDPKGQDIERFEPGRLIVFHQMNVDGLVGTVFLESDLQELHQRFEAYLGIIFLFMIASSALTWFLSSLLQRVITRPIFDLAETARMVSAEKNYSVRVAKYGRDELGQLVDGFNEMLGQIQDRDSKLQNANDELEGRVEERT